METVTDLSAGEDAHEARLLQRAANGDHDAAMGELYDRYGRRLYGYGLRALGDPGLAEDLVQETFVRLWRAAGRFDAGQGTVRGYLFTIARNAAVDLHRRRPRHERAELGDPPAEGDAFEALVTRLAVRDAVEALPDDFREVLELSYDQELSQAQIAERLEMPVGTVKSRTFYALRALKTQLTLRGVHG
ncbi:RNA polymerase sigma factor [Gaiella sp.]|uniref:RNA polymerase sigma factor n=1 Tax=Gaiella sp. TaxID=2663207 RepID=UPI00398337DE